MIKRILLPFFFLLIIKASLFAQAPSNDDCSNALFISMPSDGDTCLNSSNQFASGDGISNPCDNTAFPPGGHEVWFTYVATGPLNTITIAPALVNGAQQVSVTVQNGNCASSYLTCFTAPTSNGTASIAFNTTTGAQVYFSVTSIQLDGDFSVCLNSSAGPIFPGSDCLNAVRLCDKTNFTCPLITPGGTAPQPACFSTAPYNPGWYQFTAGLSGTMELTATPSGGAFRWALYDITAGCPVAATPPLACNNIVVVSQQFGLSSTVASCATNSFCPPANLVAGNTYALMVDDTSGSLTTFDAVWGGTFQISPTANFTVDSTFACGTLTANFTNSSSGAAGTTYTWDFGDASPVYNGVTPPPHPYTAGTYVVTLTANSGGCSSTRTQEIKVNSKPVSSFTVDNDTICYTTTGLNISTFTYTGSSSTIYCIWDFGPNGSVFSQGPGPVWDIIWSASGAQPVSLYVSENGCSSDTTRDTIHIFDPPTSDFSFNLPDDSVCTGDTITAIYNGTAGGAALYAWTYGFGDTMNVTPTSFSVVWNTPGTGQDIFSLTVQENGCLSNTTYDTLYIIQTPAVAFVTNLTRACENEIVNTEATQTLGSGGVYSWGFDGGIAIPSSPNGSGPYPVSWNNTGNVIISVTISESGCVSDPAFDTLHVYPVPTDTFTISLTQLCGIDSASIIYNGSGGSAATYNWNFGGGSTTPASTTASGPFKVTYPAPGQYYITLQVTDSACISPTHTDTIDVGTYPVAAAGPDTGACSNSQVIIGSNPVAGNTYSWSPSIGIVVNNIANPGVLFPNFSLQDTSIIYYVTVTQGFCNSIDTVKVTIHPRQLASFFPPPAQCQNENSVDFTSYYDSIAGSTYLWDFGANAVPLTSGIASPTGIHFSTSGQQTVTLTTQSPGCPADVFQDVMQINPSPVVDFFVDDSTGCPPHTVQFTDNSPALGGATILWNFGNGDTASGSNPLYTYALSGFYNPTLTYISIDNCTTTDTLPMPIDVFPVPDPTFQALPPITDDLHPYILFSYDEPNVACFYDFGDGTTGTECVMSHTYADTGVYLVTMVVTTQNGCKDTSYQTVEINTFYTFYIPNGFTPNNDGRNDVFYVQGVGVDDYEIDVFNRRGQVVYKSIDPYQVWNGKYFNTGALAPEGVYVYVLKTRDVNNKKHTYKGRVTLVR